MSKAVDIGSRVATRCGESGHVENIEDDLYGVRLLTPNNEPSCLVTWTDSVEPVGEHVVPAPKSAQWWDEAETFCGAIQAALQEELAKEEG